MEMDPWSKEVYRKTGTMATPTMEFDFNVAQRPDLYHEGAETMSRLPQKVLNTPEMEIDIDDDIPTYCILRQNTDPIVATEQPNMATVPMYKEILKAQKNDVCCQSIA